MTKVDLIEKMVTDADISKAAAGKALDSFVDGIKKTLKKGDTVTSWVSELSQSVKGLPVKAKILGQVKSSR
jgi:DNA-binding protein